MAVKDAGPGLPQNGLHPVQHPPEGLRSVIRPQGAGVQVAEVDAGDQALVQGAQLQHLLQIPQLVDLAHGLGTQGDVAEALAVAGPDHLPQGAEGSVQRLPTGALHQGAGVDHNSGRPPSDWPPGRRR